MTHTAVNLKTALTYEYYQEIIKVIYPDKRVFIVSAIIVTLNERQSYAQTYCKEYAIINV